VAPYHPVQVVRRLRDAHETPLHGAEQLPPPKFAFLDAHTRLGFVGVEQFGVVAHTGNRAATTETPRANAHPPQVFGRITDMSQLPVEHGVQTLGADDDVSEPEVPVDQTPIPRCRTIGLEPTKCDFESRMRLAGLVHQLHVLGNLVLTIETIDRRVIDTMDLGHRTTDLRCEPWPCGTKGVVTQDLACDGLAFDRSHHHEGLTQRIRRHSTRAGDDLGDGHTRSVCSLENGYFDMHVTRGSRSLALKDERVFADGEAPRLAGRTARESVDRRHTAGKTGGRHHVTHRIAQCRVDRFHHGKTLPLRRVTPALELRHISLHRDATTILDDVSWTVRPGEHWIVLGANGSGKTSLVRIAALYLHPSAGEVVVTGERLGDTDVRSLRRRVAYMSAAFATELRPQLRAFEVVMTAKNAALEPWWHTYDDSDRQRAVECLERLGVEHLADREVSTLSSGEQQRVFLARTRMNDPAVVLLDEPSGRLDLGGREQLVRALDDTIASDPKLASAIVTHHVDEIPTRATHLLALKRGRLLGRGPIGETLTNELLSDTFEFPLRVEHRDDGRFSARPD